MGEWVPAVPRGNGQSSRRLPASSSRSWTSLRLSLQPPGPLRLLLRCDPWVVENVFQVSSLLNVNLKQNVYVLDFASELVEIELYLNTLLDQILAFWRHPEPEAEFCRANLCVGLEGNVAADHIEEEDSERPDGGGFSLVLAVPDPFGRRVHSGAY